MRMRLLYGIFFVSLVLFLNGHAIGNDQKVTIYCDSSYPPYSYDKEGSAAGIYTEIFRKAFSYMTGYDVKIKPLPWKRGLNFIQTGKGFAIYPPYYRPKKRPYMDYPIAVLDEGYDILANEKSANTTRSKWPEDYVGQKIGINLGYAIPQLKKAKAQGVRIQESPNTKSNLLKLITGRIDYYISDKTVAFWGLKQLKANGKYDENKHYKIVATGNVSKEKGYLAFTNMDKGHFAFKDDFIAQYVAAINKIKANGELQAILNNYIK